MYFWHASMDGGTGDIDATNPNLEVKQLTIHAKSWWMGMRETMEFDGSDYYIHALVTEESKREFYVRVNPVSSATVNAIRINKHDHAAGFDAVWIGSKTQTFSPSNYQVFAYEAYFVGYHKKYKAF